MVSPATGLELVSRDGQRFRFDAGTLCLELLLTGGEGPLSVFEILRAPEDLAAWLPKTRLGPATYAVSADELATTKRLRSALWRLAAAQAHGRPLPDSDIDTLNDAAAAPPPIPWLGRARQPTWREPVTGSQAAAALARDAIELFGGPSRGRVRECAAHDCSLIFVDTSRPGRRRWCAMERCGNRAKQRARRNRLGSESAGG